MGSALSVGGGTDDGGSGGASQEPTPLSFTYQQRDDRLVTSFPTQPTTPRSHPRSAASTLLTPPSSVEGERPIHSHWSEPVSFGASGNVGSHLPSPSPTPLRTYGHQSVSAFTNLEPIPPPQFHRTFQSTPEPHQQGYATPPPRYSATRRDDLHHDDHFEEPPPSYTGSTGLLTPNSSPARPSQNASTRQRSSRRSETLLDASELTDPAVNADIYQELPASSLEPFKELEYDDVPLVDLDPVEIQVDGQTSLSPSYLLPNGQTLKWYQALDSEVLVAETVARARMKIKGDPRLVDVAQGKILNYEMGAGKTHTALTVIDQTLIQLDDVFTKHGLEFEKKPVLIVVEKGLHEQWKRHAEELFNLRVKIYDKGNQPLPSGDYDILLVNIDLTRNQLGRILDNKLKEPSQRQNFKPHLAAPFFQTSFLYIIVDEFHKYSNPTSSTICKFPSHSSSIPPSARISAKRRNRQINNALKKAKTPSGKTRTIHLKLEEVVHKLNFEYDNTILERTMITRRTEGLPVRKNFLVEVRLAETESALHDYMEDAYSDCICVQFIRTRQACIHPGILLRAGAVPPGVQMVRGRTGYYLTDSGNDDCEDVSNEFGDLDMDIDEDSVRDHPPLDKELGKPGDIFSDGFLSSKFQVVLGLLRRHYCKNEKTLIFSSFVTVLDVLSECLDAHGIGQVRYDGSMSTKARQEVLDSIVQDDESMVMLVSIKSGGTGLNITSCNNVVILDPWWNPYVEEQAISRAHRLGQEKEVNVYRIIAPNTVEDKICKAQHRKFNIIDPLQDRCAATTIHQDALRKTRQATGRSR
ncbi:DNA repair protein RAD5 [Coprinopsis cinerea AmutBmut pab1-1]|nr:DNA repair protein RAD5 [Coprinopsis cinerea AmutBmut pab1-1]